MLVNCFDPRKDRAYWKTAYRLHGMARHEFTPMLHLLNRGRGGVPRLPLRYTIGTCAYLSLHRYGMYDMYEREGYPYGLL